MGYRGHAKVTEVQRSSWVMKLCSKGCGEQQVKIVRKV